MSTFDAGKIEASLVLRKDQFNKDLEDAKADAAKFSGKDYTARIKADTTAADKGLTATQAKADKLGKTSATVKVSVGDAQTTAQIAQIQARVQRLNNILARPKVSLEAQKAYTELGELNALLDELGKKQPTAKVEADTAAAQAKVDDLTAKLDRLETRDTEVRVKASADLLKAQADLQKIQQQLGQIDNTTATVKVNAGSAKDAGSWIASLIGAATAVAPAFAVAGIGIASFAALAAPSIAKVVKAQADLTSKAAGASAEYKALSQSQKTLLAGVTQLEGSYKRLSVAVQPQVMHVFNEALGVADTILPHLVPLAKEGGDALAGLIRTLGGVATDPQAHQFAQFLGKEIPQDMQAVAGLLPPIVHLFESLVTDLNPLAVATLHFASGLVSVVDSLSRAAPWLTDTAVAALALYKPLLAIKGLDIAGKFTGITASLAQFGTAALAAKADAAFDAAIAGGLDAEAAAAAAAAVSMEGLSAAETAAATAGGLLEAVSPLAWAALAAVALGVLIVKLATAKDAAQQFNNSLQSAISGSSLSNLDNTILSAVVQTQGKVASSARAVTAAMKDQQPVITGVAGHFEQNYNPALDHAAEVQDHYRQGLTLLQQQAGLVSSRVAKLSQEYGGNTAALALLNSAGITSAQITDKLGGHWVQAEITIAAAAAAQKALELGLGRTSAAANAQGNTLVTTLLPAMAKITSAEDALIGVITGGETAFVGFEQSIGKTSKKLGAGSGLAQDAAAAGASLSGLNSQSLTLANDFYGSVIPAAQKLIDAVQTQQVSTHDLTTVVATQAGQMLKYAGHNDTARASIVALINNALGPGTVSMKDLTKWTGQNSTTMAGFKEIIDKATGSAAKLAGLIGSDLNAVMAQAVVDARGGQKAFDGFAQSVLGGKTQGDAFSKEGTSVVASLLAQSGNAATAKKNFETFAISGLGQSKTAADALWTSLSHQLLVQTASKAGESEKAFETFASQLGLSKKAADALWISLHKIPAKTNVSVNETGVGKFTISSSTNPYKTNSSAGNAGISGRAATGGHITGPGGPRSDRAGLFALSDNEWVIQASSAQRYGHAAMSAVNQGNAVIGYASGGQVGGTVASLAGQTTQFHQRFVSDMTSAMESAMTAAMKSAAKKAQAEFVGGNVNYKPGAGVEQWRGVVIKALALAGASTSLANNVLYQMQTESGGNPKAVNLWDSNAKAGHPSVGLMQVISGTYKAYGAPKMGYPAPVAYGVSEQPLANTYAGIRYAQSAYGPGLRSSRGGIGSGHGYARGTDGAAAGWALTGEQGPELVKMRGGETVLPAHVTSRILGGNMSYPGYAKGTPNVSASSIAGLISGAPKGGWQKDVGDLKSELKIITTSLGIKGLSKSDISKLKAEQGSDQTELLVATAYLGALTKARKQITSVTEPKLKAQIAALAGLGKTGKLSASETRLLAKLKASLAGQENEAARIYTAIYGKSAAKAKAASSSSSSDSSSSDGSSSATASSGPAPGRFVGTLPSPPGLGGANITGGGTGGLGGDGSTITGIGGFTSANGYTIAPASSAAGGAGGVFPPSAFGGGGNVERLLGQILAATRAAPAQTGGHLGAALNGTARQAYYGAVFPSGF